MWINDVFKEGGILDKIDKEAVCTFFLLFAWSGDTRIMKTPGTINFDGIGLSEEQYCHKLRMTPEKFREMTKILCENEMITYEKGVITIVNFKYWQDKKAGEDEDELKNEVKFEPKNEVKKLRSKEVRSKNKEKPLETVVSLADVFFHKWNETVIKIQTSPCKPVLITAMIPRRCKELAAREKEYQGKPLELIDCLVTSDFLSGRAPRGPGHENFRITVDWYLKASNFIKILEGNFNNKEKSKDEGWHTNV